MGTEIHSLNPIQVTCPGCQKLFLVRPEDLAPGEVRFQCTGCTQIFAFRWPLVEEAATVVATLVQPPTPAKNSPPAPPPIVKATRACARCGEKVDVKLVECPKCGVLFDKIKKLRAGDPVVKAATPELLAAWEAVRANYVDEPRHESFIQLCLSRDNLAFASQQYRQILDANPSEQLANRMQNRIIELATFSYLSSQQHREGVKKLSGVAKIMTVFASLLMVSGFFVPQGRSLIALGGAILVFIFTARHFNNR
jgi:hypothetical protein